MAESNAPSGHELWRVLELFATLQAEQEQGFLAGVDQELEVGLGQRQQLFSVMQHQLELVVPGVTLPPAEEARLREKIGELLAGEQRLAAAASLRRAEVGDQLGRLRKGRIGLNGYRFCDRVAAGPRFVSSKG